MIHDLKCWPEFFQAVKSGIKPFELRKDDRGFAVGDVLHLREFDPDTALYTGDEVDKTVTYVLPTKLFGALGEGAKYVIMGLAPRDWTPCAEGLPTFEDEYAVTIRVDVVNTNIDRRTTRKWVNDCHGNGHWFGGSIFETVLAWQPLPAAWKEPENV